MGWAGRVLPLLVKWSHLVPLIPAWVVTVHSGDLLTRHPVSADDEQIVIEDGWPIPSDISHIWGQVVCKRFPSLLHLSVPQHGPGLVLIRHIQGQTAEVSNGYKGGGAFHSHLFDLVSDRRGKADKLWTLQHGVIVAAHIFEAGIMQIVSTVNFREAVQLHTVIQADFWCEQLKDRCNLQEGSRLNQILQSLVDNLNLGCVDELQDQFQAGNAEPLQLHRILGGFLHSGAVQRTEVVALLYQFLFIYLIYFVIHDDSNNLVGWHDEANSPFSSFKAEVCCAWPLSSLFCESPFTFHRLGSSVTGLYMAMLSP